MEPERKFAWGTHESGLKVRGIPEAEFHVLIGLCSGMSIEEIASRMMVTVHTVRSHKSRLFARLNAHTGHQAIVSAWRRDVLHTCPVCRRTKDDDAPVVELEEIKVPPKAREVDGLKLTKRLGQVLRMLARGMSNLEIGKALGVSEITIKTHVRLLFAALSPFVEGGVHDRAHAVAVAYELELLRVGDTPVSS
jgi:DNA-binding NarL/FixJ family response regulator